MKLFFLLGIAINISLVYVVDKVSGQSIAGLEQCISHKKVIGCSIPFNSSFPYRKVFKPACNRHEVCYHCGSRFDWSRNDCDVGFLYDMYYACAIKDVEQRRRRKGKRKLRSVAKLIKKSTSSENTAAESKDKKSEGNIENDEKTIESIRETAEKLIQHDTASFIANLKGITKDAEKRAKADEHTKMQAEKKEVIVEELENIAMESKKNAAKGLNEKKGEPGAHHDFGSNGETKHKKKTEKATEKLGAKSKHHGKEKNAKNISEHKLKLISSKYHEIEKVLLELKGMVESEEERLKGKNEVKNNLHSAIHKDAGIQQNSNLKKTKDIENGAKLHLNSKEITKESKKKEESNTRNTNINNIESNKRSIALSNKNQIKKEENIEHEDERKKAAENEKPGGRTLQQNESLPEGKTFFQRCKLAAYLYFIAVRGFGDKFYLKEAPSWCQNGCVKASGGPHAKKSRRPRAAH